MVEAGNYESMGDSISTVLPVRYYIRFTYISMAEVGTSKTIGDGTTRSSQSGFLSGQGEKC